MMNVPSNIIDSIPPSEFVTLEEVAVQASIDADVIAEGVEEKWINNILIPAARDYIEQVIRRPIVARPVKYVFSQYYCSFKLWQTQLFGVVSGAYLTEDMVEVSIDGAMFKSTSNSWPNYITLSEPPADIGADSDFSITVTAGVVANATDVPAILKQAILMAAAEMYKNRENTADKPMNMVALQAERLVENYVNPHI